MFCGMFAGVFASWSVSIIQARYFSSAITCKEGSFTQLMAASRGFTLEVAAGCCQKSDDGRGRQRVAGKRKPLL
jgi:hypothetical protein